HGVRAGPRMVGMVSERTSQDDRQSLDGRMQAAAQLLVTVGDELDTLHFRTVGDELARRRLQVLTAAVLKLAERVRLTLDVSRRLLDPDACPHCAWFRPPERSGICPRCKQPRGAPRV